jgi:membrane associated rhomboid family serine protease
MNNVIRRPFRYTWYNVSLIIIGLNILVFLAEKVIPLNLVVSLSGRRFRLNSIAEILSMMPLMVENGYIWQFVTYMFVHDPYSLSHLIFNMLALFIFGSAVERRMGSSEFLLYYMLTGVLAGVFSFILYAFFGINPMLMGASGAIFAVQLAYAVLYPQSVIFIWGIIPMRAPVMVLGATAVELVLLFIGRGNVAHGTHLFGFLFGWLYFLARFGINPWKAMRRY